MRAQVIGLRSIILVVEQHNESNDAMSIKVMSWVWENGPADAVDRLVLLALADFCNDTGDCWPSMDTIGAKACMTGRGARNVVRRLQAEGWISVAVGGGRGGCSRYHINLPKAEQDTGKGIPGKPFPEAGDKKPGTWKHKTRNAGSAEPSRTVNEPARERAKDFHSGFKKVGATAMLRSVPLPLDDLSPAESAARRQLVAESMAAFLAERKSA
jgi:hypothetical protein